MTTPDRGRETGPKPGAEQRCRKCGETRFDHGIAPDETCGRFEMRPDDYAQPQRRR
jgi:hypothetical protein